MKMNNLVFSVLRVGLAAAIGMAALAASGAAVRVGGLFTDNAVLQQGLPIPVWGTADPGERVAVTLGGDTSRASADATGKWSLKLAPRKAGGPFDMRIEGSSGSPVVLKNVLVGEVWICGGQSNMAYCLKGWSADALTPAAIPEANDPLLHFAILPNAIALSPADTIRAQWRPATPATVPLLTAVGYFFGRDLRRALGVPVGLIHDNFSGSAAQAWTSKGALAANPSLRRYVDEEEAAVNEYPAKQAQYDRDLAAYQARSPADASAANTVAAAPPKQPVDPVRWFNGAGHLYNGMIAPIIPYGIRGVIWYQGEANAGQGFEYETLFPALIADWRNRWGEGDFPFLYVQLAPYMSIRSAPMPIYAGGWQELREAQRLTLATVANTGMAVTTDLGDSTNVHGRRKEPVGDRLALIARAKVYGQPVEYCGPMVDAVVQQGSSVRVRFTHAEGLKAVDVHDGADDGPLIAKAGVASGFEIAGKNGRYYPANAVIDGDSILLSNPNVIVPVGVRYGWANYPVANLSNAAGLPASPFKSDPWPLPSEPKPAANAIR